MSKRINEFLLFFFLSHRVLFGELILAINPDGTDKKKRKFIIAQDSYGTHTCSLRVNIFSYKLS